MFPPPPSFLNTILLLPAKMAEMYGELMEFNDRLHHDLSMRDGIICKLVNCVQQAGLKVRAIALLLHPHDNTMTTP